MSRQDPALLGLAKWVGTAAGIAGAVSALLAGVADLFSGYASPPGNQMNTAYSVTLESGTPLLLLKDHEHLVAGH